MLRYAGKGGAMGKIKFTTTDALGNPRTLEVHDDVLLYDANGDRTVDPTTLEVGDMICALGGCPGSAITVKELL
jgi:hypothetical protein